MIQSLLKSEIKTETDIVYVRQKAREIAQFLKFDNQEQIRIATAISEIARNIYQYAKEGHIVFSLERSADQIKLNITASDKGPGIERIDDILSGNFISENGMGVGLMGARRLMDDMKIETKQGKGTTITLSKFLKTRLALLSSTELGELHHNLINHKNPSPVQELQKQNHEILMAMEELNRNKEELVHLNIELENTNRGVVALYAELDEKAEFLKMANETKTSFLSDMTHEFRSPLNSIMSIAQIVLDEARISQSPEREKQMSFILKAAMGLSDLVNDLLDISKIEAGKVQVKKTTFSTHDLLGALKGLMRPINIRESVKFNFVEEENFQITSDEAKVSQILRNLISNAIKYTTEGEITVEVRKADDHLVFAVRDTGIGIAEENLGMIFDEFSQVENELQKENKGTGLGLPLSLKLAKLLNGTIEVKSKVGTGSTFFLKIPSEYMGPEDATYNDLIERKKKIADSGKFIPSQSKNKKVLVIDDEEASRYAISKSLEDLKIDYREATNGMEGWPMTLSFKPDLIILDLIMPQKDGFEYLQDFLSERSTRNIPIILHSSTVMEPEELEYLNQVTVKFVPKGSDHSELRKAVINVLYPETFQELKHD